MNISTIAKLKWDMKYISLDKCQIAYQKYFYINNSLASSVKIFNTTWHHESWKNMLFEFIRNDQHRDLKQILVLFCIHYIIFFFSLSFGRFAP